MKRIYLLIITLLISFSCTNREKNYFWFLDKDIDYKRVESVFIEYISFFPKKGDAENLNTTWSLNPDVEYNLKVLFSYDNLSFKEKKAWLENLSVAKYEASNDSLFVLNRFSSDKNYGYPNKNEVKRGLISQKYFDDLLPIPNFSNFSSIYTNTTVCKLPEDFIIYVLNAKSGVFLEEEQLTKGKYMPKNWIHGYSKGVAVSSHRNEMIYWVIIW